jgi:signal peptidase I
MPRGFWKGTFKLLFALAIVASAVIGVLRAFFVDVVTVAHNGMAPTMLLGDRVLVWRGTRIDRNDIALCRHPQHSDRWVMARVAATRGQSIAVERGGLLIDGDRVSRDIQGEGRFTDTETGRSFPASWGIENFANYEEHRYLERSDRDFTMRSQANVGGLFLLGDNRAHTGEDSRAFGVVQEGTCRGTVFMRLHAAEGAPEGIPHEDFQLLD